jgi:hypothetical protein
MDINTLKAIKKNIDKESLGIPCININAPNFSEPKLTYHPSSKSNHVWMNTLPLTSPLDSKLILEPCVDIDIISKIHKTIKSENEIWELVYPPFNEEYNPEELKYNAIFEITNYNTELYQKILSIKSNEFIYIFENNRESKIHIAFNNLFKNIFAQYIWNGYIENFLENGDNIPNHLNLPGLINNKKYNSYQKIINNVIGGYYQTELHVYYEKIYLEIYGITLLNESRKIKFSSEKSIINFSLINHYISPNNIAIPIYLFYQYRKLKLYNINGNNFYTCPSINIKDTFSEKDLTEINSLNLESYEKIKNLFEINHIDNYLFDGFTNVINRKMHNEDWEVCLFIKSNYNFSLLYNYGNSLYTYNTYYGYISFDNIQETDIYICFFKYNGQTMNDFQKNIFYNLNNKYELLDNKLTDSQSEFENIKSELTKVNNKISIEIANLESINNKKHVGIENKIEGFNKFKIKINNDDYFDEDNIINIVYDLKNNIKKIPLKYTLTNNSDCIKLETYEVVDASYILSSSHLLSKFITNINNSKDNISHPSQYDGDGILPIYSLNNIVYNSLFFTSIYLGTSNNFKVSISNENYNILSNKLSIYSKYYSGYTIYGMIKLVNYKIPIMYAELDTFYNYEKNKWEITLDKSDSQITLNFNQCYPNIYSDFNILTTYIDIYIGSQENQQYMCQLGELKIPFLKDLYINNDSKNFLMPIKDSLYTLLVNIPHNSCQVIINEKFLKLYAPELDYINNLLLNNELFNNSKTCKEIDIYIIFSYKHKIDKGNNILIGDFKKIIYSENYLKFNIEWLDNVKHEFILDCNYEFSIYLNIIGNTVGVNELLLNKKITNGDVARGTRFSINDSSNIVYDELTVAWSPRENLPNIYKISPIKLSKSYNYTNLILMPTHPKLIENSFIIININGKYHERNIIRITETGEIYLNKKIYDNKDKENYVYNLDSLLYEIEKQSSILKVSKKGDIQMNDSLIINGNIPNLQLNDKFNKNLVKLSAHKNQNKIHTNIDVYNEKKKDFDTRVSIDNDKIQFTNNCAFQRSNPLNTKKNLNQNNTALQGPIRDTLIISSDSALYSDNLNNEFYIEPSQTYNIFRIKLGYIDQVITIKVQYTIIIKNEDKGILKETGSFTILTTSLKSQDKDVDKMENYFKILNQIYSRETIGTEISSLKILKTTFQILENPEDPTELDLAISCKWNDNKIKKSKMIFDITNFYDCISNTNEEPISIYPLFTKNKFALNTYNKEQLTIDHLFDLNSSGFPNYMDINTIEFSKYEINQILLKIYKIYYKDYNLIDYEQIIINKKIIFSPENLNIDKQSLKLNKDNYYTINFLIQNLCTFNKTDVNTLINILSKITKNFNLENNIKLKDFIINYYNVCILNTANYELSDMLYQYMVINQISEYKIEFEHISTLKLSTNLKTKDYFFNPSLYHSKKITINDKNQERFYVCDSDIDFLVLKETINNAYHINNYKIMYNNNEISNIKQIKTHKGIINLYLEKYEIDKFLARFIVVNIITKYRNSIEKNNQSKNQKLILGNFLIYDNIYEKKNEIISNSQYISVEEIELYWKTKSINDVNLNCKNIVHDHLSILNKNIDNDKILNLKYFLDNILYFIEDYYYIESIFKDNKNSITVKSDEFEFNFNDKSNKFCFNILNHDITADNDKISYKYRGDETEFEKEWIIICLSKEIEIFSTYSSEPKYIIYNTKFNKFLTYTNELSTSKIFTESCIFMIKISQNGKYNLEILQNNKKVLVKIELYNQFLLMKELLSQNNLFDILQNNNPKYNNYLNNRNIIYKLENIDDINLNLKNSIITHSNLLQKYYYIIELFKNFINKDRYYINNYNIKQFIINFNTIHSYFNELIDYFNLEEIYYKFKTHYFNIQVQYQVQINNIKDILKDSNKIKNIIKDHQDKKNIQVEISKLSELTYIFNQLINNMSEKTIIDKLDIFARSYTSNYQIIKDLDIEYNKEYENIVEKYINKNFNKGKELMVLDEVINYDNMISLLTDYINFTNIDQSNLRGIIIDTVTQLIKYNRINNYNIVFEFEFINNFNEISYLYHIYDKDNLNIDSGDNTGFIDKNIIIRKLFYNMGKKYTELEQNFIKIKDIISIKYDKLFDDFLKFIENCVNSKNTSFLLQLQKKISKFYKNFIVFLGETIQNIDKIINTNILFKYYEEMVNNIDELYIILIKLLLEKGYNVEYDINYAKNYFYYDILNILGDWDSSCNDMCQLIKDNKLSNIDFKDLYPLIQQNINSKFYELEFEESDIGISLIKEFIVDEKIEILNLIDTIRTDDKNNNLSIQLEDLELLLTKDLIANNFIIDKDPTKENTMKIEKDINILKDIIDNISIYSTPIKLLISLDKENTMLLNLIDKLDALTKHIEKMIIKLKYKIGYINHYIKFILSEIFKKLLPGYYECALITKEISEIINKLHNNIDYRVQSESRQLDKIYIENEVKDNILLLNNIVTSLSKLLNTGDVIPDKYFGYDVPNLIDFIWDFLELTNDNAITNFIERDNLLNKLCHYISILYKNKYINQCWGNMYKFDIKDISNVDSVGEIDVQFNKTQSKFKIDKLYLASLNNKGIGYLELYSENINSLNNNYQNEKFQQYSNSENTLYTDLNIFENNYNYRILPICINTLIKEFYFLDTGEIFINIIKKYFNNSNRCNFQEWFINVYDILVKEILSKTKQNNLKNDKIIDYNAKRNLNINKFNTYRIDNIFKIGNLQSIISDNYIQQLIKKLTIKKYNIRILSDSELSDTLINNIEYLSEFYIDDNSENKINNVINKYKCINSNKNLYNESISLDCNYK